MLLETSLGQGLNSVLGLMNKVQAREDNQVVIYFNFFIVVVSINGWQENLPITKTYK